MNELNKSNLNSELLDTDKPIVLDFWANWCGPCERLAPVIDELSSEMTDAIFVKINIDDSMEIAKKFKVMSIPTIKIIKNGEVVDTSIGYKDKNDLKSIIEKHI
ncbi:thioredoxin [Clostridium ihumii]|uniref:thioredoxin n=1 Tax=Clostridium ihumii TaxID=1470356 RepID=UPI00058C94AD|nr:thioredoxin [Clostridium ihumii]